MTCPTCGGDNLKPFFLAGAVPVFCNVLPDTPALARAAERGEIRLLFCPDCRLIHNAGFDPGLLSYSVAYENALHFSPTFRQYADRLADYLVDRYRLHGKDILEIGSSDGAFLADLCRRGGNRGVGFDPGCDPAAAAGSPAVTMVAQAYGPDSSHYPADFICCRHVLEHVADPLAFLGLVRAAIGDRADTRVFFEVPDATYTLRQLGVWDIIYEHKSYFLPASLGELFARAGFDVTKIAAAYGGQFLTLEAAPGRTGQAPRRPRDDGIDQLIDRFAQAYEAKVLTWGRELHRLAGTGRKTVVWGAGSKGVTFLNTLGVDTDRVAFVVDVNPRKHGRFIPGTAQQVVAPEFLVDYRPDAIIVMNPLYADEISQTARRMNLAADLMQA